LDFAGAVGLCPVVHPPDVQGGVGGFVRDDLAGEVAAGEAHDPGERSGGVDPASEVPVVARAQERRLEQSSGSGEVLATADFAVAGVSSAHEVVGVGVDD